MAITVTQRRMISAGETEVFALDFTDTLDAQLGTARSATSTSLVLAWDASAANDAYNSRIVVITGGTGAGQWATITDYIGATRTCIVATWGTTPDASSTYRVTEILTGTPTIAEVTTTDLTLGSKAINTAPLHLDDLEADRVCYPGCGVQWTVAGQVAGAEYRIRITVGPNGSPARTLVRDVRFRTEQ